MKTTPKSYNLVKIELFRVEELFAERYIGFPDGTNFNQVQEKVLEVLSEIEEEVLVLYDSRDTEECQVNRQTQYKEIIEYVESLSYSFDLECEFNLDDSWHRMPSDDVKSQLKITLNNLNMVL